MRYLLLLPFALITLVASAQTRPSSVEADVSLLKDEGFHRSEAMKTLEYLSDVLGPRLTGSHEYLKSAIWTKAKLESWKLDNVHFESYCNDCRGWTIKSFDVSLVSPNYMKILAYPLTMSRSTRGVQTAPVVYIADYADMTKVREQFAGKLKDKIVLAGRPPKIRPQTEPLSKRLTNEQVGDASRVLAAKRKSKPLPELLASFDVDDKSDEDFHKFLDAEGAVALLTTSDSNPGLIHAMGTYYYRDKDLVPLPLFSIAAEHFGRLIRMIDKGETPQLRVDLDAEIYLEPKNNVNIIAEITGSDPKLKSEVVMLGGHFDSWHASTGATDNGAGAVAAMEAMRLIRALGLKPRRTIRLGLWGGEEQAYLGSVGYAAQHFGPLDQAPNAESQKVSAYINIDNGAGAIRGIYLQDNEKARVLFEQILKPFQHLSGDAITIENTFSTDHDVFDFYNIPAFQVYQDPLNYFAVTHHTNLDAVEYVPEEDLKRNSVIMAAIVYQLAMSDARVPRKK